MMRPGETCLLWVVLGWLEAPCFPAVGACNHHLLVSSFLLLVLAFLSDKLLVQCMLSKEPSCVLCRNRAFRPCVMEHTLFIATHTQKKSGEHTRSEGGLTSHCSVGQSCWWRNLHKVLFSLAFFLTRHPLYFLGMQWHGVMVLLFSMRAQQSFIDAAFCWFASKVCVFVCFFRAKRESNDFCSFLTVTLVLEK